MESLTQLPLWLESLLREKFFNACLIHEEVKRNEKNIFCLDCCEGICPHCSSPHRSHRLLQIRRYNYCDVIRVDDAEKLMDCASVQSYSSNGGKVVFLNQRPPAAAPRLCRGLSNVCFACDRALQDPFLFCSLSCKLQHILRSEKNLSKYIFDCEYLILPETGYDDGLMTPESVLEPDGSLKTSSASIGSGGAAACGGVGCWALGCTATTEILRKKRSIVSACRPVSSPAAEMSAGLMSRRKGIPHRSPHY